MSLSSRRGIYLSYTRLTLISGALAIFYLCSSSTRISLARSRGIVSLPDWPKQSSAPESHGGIGRPFPSWLHFEPQTQATTVQRPAGKRSSSTAATSTSSSTPSPSATSEDDLPPWTRSSTSENATESASTDCRGLPGASDTLVILKTGATEIYEKLPAHFVTTLRCSTDYLIFSDVEQDIGPFHVHDALAAVSADIKASHKDFELYRQLQQYRAEGQDAALLKGGSGWDLDKWKFVPMVVGAYRMRPEARWFVFIEADTFLSWANTLAWLRLLDAERPLYLGAQVMIGDTEFAHGGSGFVLSRAAARRLSERERERKEAWEERTLHECCGDKVLADALMEDGIKLTRSFPLIQGERVWSLDWSETHWCRAAVTWHHVRPSEVDAYWQFEQAWRANRSTPILYRDFYKHFVRPHLGDPRSGWDNLSKDWTLTSSSTDGHHAQEAYSSFEACRAACELREDCLQYMWEPGNCNMGKVVKMGKPVDLKDDRTEVKSGWMVKRVEQFVERVDRCREDERVWILPEE